ncbi:hypothetical protein B9Z55_008275 [Caenorhabditis nigoni]|uniref:RING-type domain-containing protein n=2 Tax=Caenorhabditis nigoni TaxID=1611254 RepID=A0A2G5VDE2_9PELO|nr:hypothetical protein B9Z55_008275 [Caenorhabditis nigoni]
MTTACHVIIQGRPNDDPLGPTGTVGLIQDGTSTILVDAGDPWNGSEIVEKLKEHQGTPFQVTHVLVTHGHLDHCANLGMFPEATVIMDWDIGKRGKERAEYSVIPGWPYRLSENCEILNLSGHTASDTIAIVQEKNRLVVYSGDLIEDAQDLQKFEDLLPLDEDEYEDLILSQEIIFGSGDVIMTSQEGGSYLQGSCSICFEDLRQTDKISAIVCGHIYHHGCISQWMAAKKQCPSCRRSVPKNGFVEKLFFDVQRMGGEVEKPAEIDYREEHYKISATLKVEKEKAEKLDAENKALKNEVKSLEKKVLKEKDKYRNEVPRLQATINHLQISSEETEALRLAVADARSKVRACEFYKILMTHSDNADKQLGEYLRKGGNLDTEKFFQLQKAQIKDLTEKRREAAKEIENLRLENQSLKRKAQEDAVTRQTLKKSVLELRERANVETPINNKRLREVLEEVTPLAAKRKSLGFDDSSQLMGEELSFFKQQENKTPPAPAASKPSTSSMAPFSFDDDDDDDEYFRTPKLTERKKKVIIPKLSNDDSFNFDITVPSNIINRIPPKLPTKVLPKVPVKVPAKVVIPRKDDKPRIEPTFSSSKTADDSFEFDLPLPSSLTTRISTKPIGNNNSSSQKSTNVPTKPPLKRHQSFDILMDLPPKRVPAPPVKTSRISSFFKRTTSSGATSSEATKKEYVTID